MKWAYLFRTLLWLIMNTISDTAIRAIYVIVSLLFMKVKFFFYLSLFNKKKISLKMGDVDRPASPLVNNKPGVTFFCTPVKKKTFHFDMDL